MKSKKLQIVMSSDDDEEGEGERNSIRDNK